MSEGVRFVVEQLAEVVRPDGGSLELLSIDGDTLRVAYHAGVNERCATCVLSAEQVGEMLRAAIREHDPTIADVEVEAAGD